MGYLSSHKGSIIVGYSAVAVVLVKLLPINRPRAKRENKPLQGAMQYKDMDTTGRTIPEVVRTGVLQGVLSFGGVPTHLINGS
jgi:hypothetical protein